MDFIVEIITKYSAVAWGGIVAIPAAAAGLIVKGLLGSAENEDESKKWIPYAFAAVVGVVALVVCMNIYSDAKTACLQRNGNTIDTTAKCSDNPAYNKIQLPQPSLHL